MAGHLALSKIDEPKLFALVNKIKYIIYIQGLYRKDFEKFKITDLKSKSFEIMKLSKEYVDNPEKERAFMVGKVSLESITDEHPSLIKDISVEVHFRINKGNATIKNIFWVA